MNTEDSDRINKSLIPTFVYPKLIIKILIVSGEVKE